MNLDHLLRLANETRWDQQKDGMKSYSRAQALIQDPGCKWAMENRNWATLRARVGELWGKGPTGNRYLSSASVLLRTWEEHGGPPTPTLRKFPESAARVSCPTEEEVTELLGRAQDPLRSVLQVLLDTGIRFSELSRLEIKGEAALLGTTKNGEPRWIPLTERAGAALLRLVGQRYSESSLRKDLKALTHYTFHDFRRYCITRLLSRGVPLAVVAKWAGHKSIATTMRYAQLGDSDLIKAKEALERA